MPPNKRLNKKERELALRASREQYRIFEALGLTPLPSKVKGYKHQYQKSPWRERILLTHGESILVYDKPSSLDRITLDRNTSGHDRRKAQMLTVTRCCEFPTTGLRFSAEIDRFPGKIEGTRSIFTVGRYDSQVRDENGMVIENSYGPLMLEAYRGQHLVLHQDLAPKSGLLLCCQNQDYVLHSLFLPEDAALGENELEVVRGWFGLFGINQEVTTSATIDEINQAISIHAMTLLQMSYKELQTYAEGFYMIKNED